MPAHLSISALPFREEEEEEPSPSYSSFPSSPSESVASLFAKSNDIPLELDADAARSAAASSRDLNVWIRLVSSGSVDRANGKGLYQRAVIIEEERKRREHHRGRIEKQSLDDELSGLPSYGSVTGDSDFMVSESLMSTSSGFEFGTCADHECIASPIVDRVRSNPSHASPQNIQSRPTDEQATCQSRPSPRGMEQAGCGFAQNHPRRRQDR